VAQLVRTAADRRRQLVGPINRLHPTTRPESSVEIAPTTAPLDGVIRHQQAPSPFDDLISAVSSRSVDLARQRGTLPPQSRFMVRVSPVDRPHRSTKRDYDYFEELNAQLAATKENGHLLSGS